MQNKFFVQIQSTIVFDAYSSNLKMFVDWNNLKKIIIKYIDTY